MTPLTEEWVEFAEGDYLVARRELRIRDEPTYNAVCFHAQQCAEKYLKARLQEFGTHFPYTHDLSDLLALALPTEPTWTNLEIPCARLTNFAVNTRYPGTRTLLAPAVAAVRHCRLIRSAVRKSLGLVPSGRNFHNPPP